MEPVTIPTDSKGESDLLNRADRFGNTNDSDSEDIFYDAYDSEQEIFYDCIDFFDQAKTKIEEKDKTSSHNNSNKVETDSSSMQPSPANSIPPQKRKLDGSNKSSPPQELEDENTKKKAKFGGTSRLGTTNTLQPVSSSPKTSFFSSKNPTSFASVSTNNATSFASLLSEKRKHDAKIEQNEASASHAQKKVKIVEEDTVFQAKGVLYVLDVNKDWKERGSGQFRLNKHENQSHLVMRSDMVFRIILNVKFFLGMQVFVMKENFIRFGALETNTNEDGKVETKMMNYVLKLKSNTTAQEMCLKINDSIPPPVTTVDNDAQTLSPEEMTTHHCL